MTRNSSARWKKTSFSFAAPTCSGSHLSGRGIATIAVVLTLIPYDGSCAYVRFGDAVKRAAVTGMGAELPGAIAHARTAAFLSNGRSREMR